MTFVTDFVVKRYGSREEYEFKLDAEAVLGRDLKKLLEPLMGVPVYDQVLAYESELMKDEESLLEGSLQDNSYKVIVSSKSNKPPVTEIEPPPDWNAENSPLFKSLFRYLEEHYIKEDISTICYHMSQYVSELGNRVSFDHLEILAEKNLKEYDDLLRYRRKHYYEFFERCIYLEKRMRASESHMSESQKALQAAFMAQQEAIMKAQREATLKAQKEACLRAQEARRKKTGLS